MLWGRWEAVNGCERILTFTTLDTSRIEEFALFRTIWVRHGGITKSDSFHLYSSLDARHGGRYPLDGIHLT